MHNKLGIELDYVSGSFYGYLRIGNANKDLELANAYLTKVFKNVVPTSVARSFALPGFENQFYVVHKHNAIITIIPKRD